MGGRNTKNATSSAAKAATNHRKEVFIAFFKDYSEYCRCGCCINHNFSKGRRCLSLREIAKRMTANGVAPMKQRNGMWSATQVSRLISSTEFEAICNLRKPKKRFSDTIT